MNSPKHSGNSVQYNSIRGGPRTRRILTGAEAKDSFKSVPQIDVSAITSSDPAARRRLAAELAPVLRTIGVFYAVNPPVRPEVIGRFRNHPHTNRTVVNRNCRFVLGRWQVVFCTPRRSEGMLTYTSYRLGSQLVLLTLESIGQVLQSHQPHAKGMGQVP